MSVSRPFVFHRVLRTDADAHALYAVLKSNREAFAERGEPLQVTVSVYKAKRKDEQNALMWVILQQIAEQAWVRGVRYDAETWHVLYKRMFLPEMNARGAPKWRVLPDGERELVMSTTELNVTEFSTYLNEVQAHAAAELGVQLSANPRDL